MGAENRGTPKSSRENRSAPVGPELASALRGHEEGHEAGSIAAFEWVMRLCDELSKSDAGSPHHFEMIDRIRLRTELELDRRYPKPNRVRTL